VENTIEKQEEAMLLFVYKKEYSILTLAFSFPKIPLTFLYDFLKVRTRIFNL